MFDAKITVFILFGLMLVLSFLSFYLFFVRSNYNFKVKYFKYFVILGGILFSLASLGTANPLEICLFIIPFIALITFVNIKFTRFCKNCGSTIINSLGETNFCPKCGSELQDRQ
jgi:hypothetical protein